MKIVTVLGARPQFIKAGTVSREIAKHDNVQEIIIHTGQHYDQNMSDIFFKEMRIPQPDYHLGIGGKTHGAMTGRMIEKIEEILMAEKPDWVMVYGDTDSTLAGAVAACKLHIKIAHVEAGLRSFNMRMPEEINRILTDRVSTMLFCPTETAVRNLSNEGFEAFPCSIIQCGDVMFDGILYYRQFAKKPFLNVEENYVLCTIHRAENTDDLSRLSSILSALRTIAKEQQVIIPLHPRTAKIIREHSIDISGLTLIDPVGYLEMVWLIDHCRLVMTDSGGLQKEAYFFAKPCITLREDTEWVELVDAGVNILAGSQTGAIETAYRDSISRQMDFKSIFYGRGNAGQRIINELLHG